MRIGSRGTTARIDAPSRLTADPEAFGAGVGRALTTIGNALSNYGEGQAQLKQDYLNQLRDANRTEARISLARAMGEMDRAVEDRSLYAEPGAAGHTNSVDRMLADRIATFRQDIQQRYPNLDEEDMREFDLAWETYSQGRVTSAFAFELDQTNTRIVSGLNDLLQESLARVRQNPALAQPEYETLRTMAEDAGLPLTALEQLDREMYQQIYSVVFEQERIAAFNQQTPVQDPATAAANGDVVAPGLSSVQRGLLSTIAGVESSYGGDSYRVLYGGSTFDSYADHPRQNIPITSGRNAGRTTSAAGRYQFLASTWDFVRENMEAEGYDFGVEPFSPVNQDRAALWYAAYRYNAHARQHNFPPELSDFNTVLQSGDPAAVGMLREVLGGQGNNTVWEGLQRLTNEQFAERLAVGAAPGGTGTSTMPDIWTDPRYNRLSYEQRTELEASSNQMIAQLLRARTAAENAQQDSLLNELTIRAQDHDPNLLAQVMQALPQFTDATRRGQALNLVADEMEMQRNASTAQAQINSGAPVAEPGTIDDYFEISRVNAGVQQRDEAAAAEVVRTFTRTGQMGPEMLDTLLAMSRQANPQNQIYALETLARMRQASPNAFLGLREEAVRDAGILWSQLARISGSQQEALQSYNFANAPENRQVRRDREESAQDILAEYDANYIFQQVTSFGERVFTDVQMPLGAQNEMFVSDFQRAFTDAYVRTQDEETARNIAAETMQSVYSPDPISGVLTYLGPNSPAARSVAPQMENENWPAEALYEQLPELRTSTGVTFITTQETQEALLRGEVPSYLVQRNTPTGGIEIVLGEDNQPFQYRLEPTARQRMENDIAVQRTHLEERRQRLLAERSAAVGRQAFGTAGPMESAAIDQQLQITEERLRSLNEVTAVQNNERRAAIEAAVRAFTWQDLQDPARREEYMRLREEWINAQ